MIIGHLARIAVIVEVIVGVKPYLFKVFVKVCAVLTQVMCFYPPNAGSSMTALYNRSDTMYKEFEVSPLHDVLIPSGASKIPI